MSHLRVVHLSDLHARGDTELEQRVIARAAIEDVGRIHDERPVDLVVFSGDLAFSGGTDEFTAAQEYFLDPLGERLGLTHERIILVPGNHDVDRTRIDQYFEKGLGDSLTGSDAVRAFLANSQAIAHAIAPLEPWRDFHAHYYDGVESLEPTSLGWVHKLELGDFSVAIAALNSAWRASGDSDHGAILLGEPQIRSALESIADADLTLAASHHPLSWLARFDGDAARREFETRAMLVLSGHEHAADPVSELSPRGGALYSRAGCLYETTDYLNGYSVLDLDAHRSATVTMRTWWPDRGVFDEATNVAEHGQVTYPWPGASLPAAITSVDYSSVMLSLTQTLQDRSAVAPEVEELKLQSVDDVLVEPRYWPVPYQEIVAARNVDPEKAPDPHSGIDALEASRVLVVAGPPESGVTSSLLWLLGQHFKVTGTRLPVYVPFAGSFNASQFERTLRGALAAVGLPVERRDELPPLVTAIDDLGTARAGPLDSLCRYVGEHPDQLTGPRSSVRTF